MKEGLKLEKDFSNIWKALAKVDKATWIKLSLMGVAFINQGLSVIGKSPLPISNEEVQEFVSLAFTIGVGIYGFFSNNAVTKKDRVAQHIATGLKDVDYDKDQYYHKYLKKEDGDK